MSGPGEFLGNYGGRITGASYGYAHGGTAGGIIGEEVGGYVGSKIGKGLDQIVEAQGKALNQDYQKALNQGLPPHQAIHYALDVNGYD